MSKTWLCRAGKKACYLDKYISENRIYLPWEGYDCDLSGVTSRQVITQIVKEEKAVENKTSLSTWSGMLFSFLNEMEVDDYVLIPHKNSKMYELACVMSDYQYESNAPLHHYRSIKIIEKDIPRAIFRQDIIYSLGAFRSLFKVRQQEDVLQRIFEYKKVD